MIMVATVRFLGAGCVRSSVSHKESKCRNGYANMQKESRRKFAHGRTRQREVSRGDRSSPLIALQPSEMMAEERSEARLLPRMRNERGARDLFFFRVNKTAPGHMIRREGINRNCQCIRSPSIREKSQGHPEVSRDPGRN